METQLEFTKGQIYVQQKCIKEITLFEEVKVPSILLILKNIQFWNENIDYSPTHDAMFLINNNKKFSTKQNPH